MLQKPGIVGHVYNVSMWEVVARASGIEAHSQLHRELDSRWATWDPDSKTKTFHNVIGERILWMMSNIWERGGFCVLWFWGLKCKYNFYTIEMYSFWDFFLLISSLISYLCCIARDWTESLIVGKTSTSELKPYLPFSFSYFEAVSH